MSYKTILLIPHIKIHNANALSSPFTIGFPAMTAWLGAAHALQRHLCAEDVELVISATGVVSHSIGLQTYRGKNDYVASIVGTGNPLEPKAEKNKPKGNAVRPSFIEEARCHLEVSLLLEIEGISQGQHDGIIKRVEHIFHSQMKLAGGDIQSFNSPEIFVIDDFNEQETRQFARKIMPGYVLIERRDLMIEAMEQGQDAIDAMIDYLAIHHTCEETKEGVVWTAQRKGRVNEPVGWIVPIATGFHGITELSKAKNQRSEDTDHRFAESLVTLGEFKMPHRFNSLTDMLWTYKVDQTSNLYQCVALNTQTQETYPEFDQ